MADKVRFTVLEGGRAKQASVNTVNFAVVQDSLSPLPVDVRVFEEDTHLVLTVDPIMRYTEEHPIRLMTKVMEAQPNAPGSIVINNASWYAIVHDLDAEPSSRPEWIENAYLAALTIAEKKLVQTLAIPLLGSVYGNLPINKSLEMLIQATKSISPKHLEKIIVLAPRQDCEKISQHLQKLTR